MADDSYFSTIVNALKAPFTDPGAFKETVNTAPPLTSYPSDYDARMARLNGFSHFSPNQSYLDNDSARVLGTQSPQGFMPASGAGHSVNEVLNLNPPTVDLSKPQNQDLRGKLDDTFMKAGLAANRSPIAAVGFDPSRVMVDSVMQHGSLGGAYGPKSDSIYTTLSPEDSIVHESTHRGLQKLREQYPEAGQAMSKLPDEETVVRWLMKSQAGDPEGKDGPVDAKQRQTGIDMFSGEKYPALASMNKESLNTLQELAIDAMKHRGKRAGPQ